MQIHIRISDITCNCLLKNLLKINALSQTKIIILRNI